MRLQQEERALGPSATNGASGPYSLTFSILREIFDLGSLLKVFKTAVFWLIKPLELDYREQEDRSARFMGDIRLAKSLFLLLVIFLALDTDHPITRQVFFLLSFVASLWLFLAIGDLWRWAAKAAPDNRRLFKSHLIYEFCTLFLLQGTALGVLGLRMFGDVHFDPLGGTLVLLLPIAHGLYFFFKLGRFHGARRRARAIIVTAPLVAFWVFVPAVFNMAFLQERAKWSPAADSAPQSSTLPDSASP